MSEFASFYARGSGRTTRMLNEVIQLVKQKQVVCVLVHDQHHVKFLEKYYQRLCDEQKITIAIAMDMVQFKTVESLRFESIDWQKKKLHYSDKKLIIDHHVYAKYFGWAIDGFHHYDDQVIVNPAQLRWLR